MKYALLLLAIMTFLLAACAPERNVTENNTTESHAHGSTVDSQPYDLLFIDGMIVHHQGAIVMAQQVLNEGEHEELRTFAQGIINAQTAEIAQMQEWREEWFAGESQSDVESHEMGDMAIAEDASVPFDQRFMQAMISHHEGALVMAQAALQRSGHDEIRALAEAVVRDQTAEIEQMRSWLREWYGIEE